jgi:hypothetical protein
MNNKVLVEVIIPKLEVTYNLYLPINKRIGNIIFLLNKSIAELNDDLYEYTNAEHFYNQETEEIYEPSYLLNDTNIRNGTTLILI